MVARTAFSSTPAFGDTILPKKGRKDYKNNKCLDRYAKWDCQRNIKWYKSACKTEKDEIKKIWDDSNVDFVPALTHSTTAVHNNKIFPKGSGFLNIILLKLY